jgi:hypothetical protein
MKIRSILAIAIVLAISAPVFAVPAAPPSAASAFDSLKTLAGTWEAKTPDGKTADTTLRLVSGGSALMEEMPHDSMVTMYHLDNNRLLMTHYCGAQNQPRMQADVSADGKTITFNFIDGTNLASPAAPHMHKMVLTFVDKDHFTEAWTFHKDSKEAEHMVIQYSRK